MCHRCFAAKLTRVWLLQPCYKINESYSNHLVIFRAIIIFRLVDLTSMATSHGSMLAMKKRRDGAAILVPQGKKFATSYNNIRLFYKFGKI